MGIKYIFTFLLLISILFFKLLPISAYEIKQFTDENGVIYLYNDPNYIPKKTESTLLRLQRISREMEEKISFSDFEVEFQTRCEISNKKPYPYISCILYFPYSSSAKYLHNIEILTLKNVLIFSRKNFDTSFEIYAVLKGSPAEESIPICAYSYWKEFNHIYSIWPLY